MDFNSKKVKEAPGKTSYFENRIQRCHVILENNYIKLNTHCNFLNLKYPFCGGKLIPRKGKYGEFLGCKKFFFKKMQGYSQVLKLEQNINSFHTTEVK